jgi:hypothetical protein
MSAVTVFDSLHKVAHYLAMISLEPFVFDGVPFRPPATLVVSPTFWRDYTCPPLCGGCCRAFSMDYFLYPPGNTPLFLPHTFTVNGSSYTCFSNRHVARQRFLSGQYCQFLESSGRCEIHDHSPLSCRFELNKLQLYPKRDQAWLGKKLYRNGWRYRRVDGGIGALCTMVPSSPRTIDVVKTRDIALLRELAELANSLGIHHRGHDLVRRLERAAGLDFDRKLVL